MKYLSVVDTCFLDVPRGSGRVAWDVLRAMQRRGHRVGMFCVRQSNDEPIGNEFRDGVDIVRYDRPNIPKWLPNRLSANVSTAAEAARKWLREDSWDIVHIHDPVLGLGVMEVLGDGPRYVTTLHSPIVLEQEVNWKAQGLLGRIKLMFGTGQLKRLEGKVLRKSDAIHTLSGFTRSKIQLYHGLGERVIVIPHWCPEKKLNRIGKHDARQRLGWPQDKMIFFSVRQLRPRYGLDLAIQAFSELDNRTDFRYYIAGHGYLHSVLERQINKFGLADQVQLMGKISDEDLALAYQAADIFVLPTRTLECFGLIILESLNWGCPLIATDAGAIPEVLGRVLPNCTIPAGDAGALRDKLLAALEGRMNFPDSEELMVHTRQVYGETLVLPRLESLLTNSVRRECNDK